MKDRRSTLDQTTTTCGIHLQLLLVVRLFTHDAIRVVVAQSVLSVYLRQTAQLFVFLGYPCDNSITS